MGVLVEGDVNDNVVAGTWPTGCDVQIRNIACSIIENENEIYLICTLIALFTSYKSADNSSCLQGNFACELNWL